MGQQKNKIIKRRRRAAYLERLKAKALLASTNKTKARKPAPKKAAAEAAAE